MASYATQFWATADEELQELAKQFEQGIELSHPKNLSGRSSAGWCNCSWCAQRVKYYEYNGPNI